ncbi:hypothetical protein [Schinkia azotoformans]|uniref:hypothetical protein n=1 Tax=Schinkia azotoformans TaxID=1454 RepID=UPI002DBBAB8F|nr:hypothetical protein [Schinkia azotoformans]MEC1744153.1 hypothetical protein [Schinkia azotoformans]
MKIDAKREVIKLALLLDEISDLHVFVDYSGHVETVSVRVYSAKEEVVDPEAKWTEQVNKIFDEYYNFNFKYEDDFKKYEATKQYLQSEIDKRIAV